MMIGSFRDGDVKAFINKILEGMKIPLRAEHMEPVIMGQNYFTFSGPGFSMRADLRDFGLGDIGFSKLSISEAGNGSIGYVHQAAMQPSLAPRRDDFLRFHASLEGEVAAKRKLSFVDDVGEMKLGLEPQVVISGAAISLSEFVVSRPRKIPVSQELSA